MAANEESAFTPPTQSARAARRREPRLPLNLEAEVAVLSFGGGEKLPARILNISRSGLGMQLARQVEVGTDVKVHWPHFVAIGEIRHCRQVDGDPGEEFEVGISIEHVFHSAALNPHDHLSADQLVLFLTRMLSEDDMRAAGAHLELCSLCKRALAVVEGLMLSDCAS